METEVNHLIVVSVLISLFVFFSCDSESVDSALGVENSEKPSVHFVSHNRKDLVLLATGDFIGASYVETAMKKYGTDYPYRKIQKQIASADIAFTNLECVVSDRGSLRSHHRKKINYNASFLVYKSLLKSGFDVFSMANNHVFDLADEGVHGMLDLFSTSPFLYGGAGRNSTEASSPALTRVNGLTVAFLFYFGNTDTFAATESSAGYNYIDFRNVKKAGKKLKRDLEKIPDDTDIIALSIHWGRNYTTAITEDQKRFAHYAVDNGVDMLLGHSAHIFHGVEIYKKRPILYDMGDIMINDDDSWDTRSMLFYVHVEGSSFTKLELLPVYIVNSQIRRAHGRMARMIMDRMRRLSRRFRTPMIEKNEMLVVPIQ